MVIIMNQSIDPYIPVGTIGRTHGIQGWVRLHSDTDPHTAITHYQPWFIRSKTDYQKLDIDGTRIQGEQILIHIKDMNDPETVQMYVNQTIYIERSQLPELPADEYYWSELVGLKVVNTEGFEFGTVDYLFETGANDVLVVKGEKKYLIPFVKDRFILNIDNEHKIITVDWDPEYNS